ncbi:MAG: hypothetical protein ACRDUA_07655 [Micromonosporaceae bacterium]
MGSVSKARTGEFGILAGGDVAPVAPVLGDLGSVTRCGESGGGAALKLALMTAVIGGVAVAGEALRVADRLGVPRELALPALAGAVTRATATDSDYPIVLAAKDPSLATEAAGPDALPVTAAVRDQLPQLAASGAAYQALSRGVEAVPIGRIAGGRGHRDHPLTGPAGYVEGSSSSRA